MASLQANGACGMVINTVACVELAVVCHPSNPVNWLKIDTVGN